MTTVPSAGRRHPAAPRLGLVEYRLGQRICDPYRWLEDAADPRTTAWLAGQEEFFAAERERWPGREQWRAELTALSAAESVLTPKARGSRIFLRRQSADVDLPTLYVAENGTERVLLDLLRLDQAGRTVLDRWEPSIEGDLLAYQLSSHGTEDSVLRVLDVATGTIVDGPIDRLRSTPVAWLPGGRMFYYVRRLPPELHPGEERYHRRVYLHRIGSDPVDDALVFGEGREMTQFYTVTVTTDGRWLTITASTGADPGRDIYLGDLSRSPAARPELRPVQESSGVRSELHIAPNTGPRDRAWLCTRHGAPNGRVMACCPSDPAVEAWRELIAERPDAVLQDLAILTGTQPGSWIGLVTWARHAIAEVTAHDLADGRQLGVVRLPGDGSVRRFSVRPEGGPDAWCLYTDYVNPPALLYYSGGSGALRPWVSTWPRPASHDVVTSRAAFRSRDGVNARLSVISPAGHADRPRPAILTGYGGFGVSMTPVFSPEAVAWARAGGIYAIACLRGGGEEGEDWHRAGRGENKQNVFDDLEAAIDYLVEAGWTSHGQLGILGGSNGGLMVGAALTQYPRKFAAAVCMSPLLDMARYELSGLGPSWRPEYGSADDPVQLKTLLSYSPYHHVRDGIRYPPVLFTVSDGDTRVDPLHARKMCAALQHCSAGKPVLFRLERGTGHGVRAVSVGIRLQADCLAFLGHHLGLPPPEGGE